MSDSVKDFKKKLLDIKEISTLPQIMSRIMQIITDEKSCASDLAEEIAKDKSLTAKILKIVNSAYYGFYREIVKIPDAVVVLGFNEIRRLSLAISVFDMFGGTERAEHRLRLWNHSLACAAMCDILAKEWGVQEKGAFTAGLLHDIGKTVLDQYFPSMFTAVQEYMEQRSVRAHEAERILFGFDHADIGFWLSDRWNLPATLSEAIRYHHRTQGGVDLSKITELVQAADELVNDYEKIRMTGQTLSAVLGNEESGNLAPDKKLSLLHELERRSRNPHSAHIFI